MNLINAPTKKYNCNSNGDLGKSWIVVEPKDSEFEQSSSSLTKSFKLGDSWVNLTDQRNSMLEYSTILLEQKDNVDVHSDLANSICIGDRYVTMPTDLTRSWVDVQKNETSETIIVARDVKDLTAKKDNAVLTKLLMIATLMEGVYKGGKFAVQNWDKIVCGVAGVMGGTAEMISINPFHIGLGALRVVASIKIMWDAYDSLTPTQIQAIVSDSKASVEGIRLLAKANDASLDRVQDYLTKAQERTTAINTHLEKIANIQDNDRTNIIELKQKAKDKYLTLQKVIEAAQSNFEKANFVAADAQVGFNNVIDDLNTMILLFQSKEGAAEERIKALADLTQKISVTAEKAYEQMQIAQSLRNEGDALFNQVSNLQSEAAEIYGQATLLAELTIEKMAKQAKKAQLQNELVENQIIEANKVIVKEIKPRNEEIQVIAKEVVQDLGIVQNALKDDSGWLRMMTCAASAVTLAPWIGTLPAVLLSYAIVKYAHALANAILNCMAKRAAKESTFVRLNDRIAYEYDYRSTSMSKKLKGLIFKTDVTSQTIGNLFVNVGNQELKMRFNLNAEKRKISTTELKDLSNAIRDEVNNKNLTDSEALELIEDLKTCEIKRKTKDWLRRDTVTIQKGFIAENEVHLKNLERDLGKVEPEYEPLAKDSEDSFDFDSFRASAVLWC